MPDSSSTLLQALQNPALYGHPVERFEILETHISWVLLTGPYAYKIKKPVDLGFVDFRELERRQYFCMEEVRLNRRLAPELYLGVVTITGTPDSPQLGGEGPPIEYAVKMKQFPQEMLLTRVLARGHLTPAHIDALAAQIADFHQRIAVADVASPFGAPDVIIKPVRENFQQLPIVIREWFGADRLERLRTWTEEEHARLIEVFQRRKAEGCIRECHGDLHLGNMALIEKTITIFDCIEFSEALRWIDVMSEMAFTVMDLHHRGCPAYGRRLLNGYLEWTGDYWGVRVFRYYQTYRAIVRAKVAGIRWEQTEAQHADRLVLREELLSYLTLAERLVKEGSCAVIILHGLSGSGKTSLAQELLEATGAIRVRSDIERKRLFGVKPHERTDKAQESVVYSEETTQAVYGRLEECARHVLAAGYPVIVDATFLRRVQRERFQRLAAEWGVPFRIVHVWARDRILQERVARRIEEARDASEADLRVLERQLMMDEPFTEEERSSVVSVNTEVPCDLHLLLGKLMGHLPSTSFRGGGLNR
ncbi:MAG: aminoglycoside phosphotransferase [Nitrospirae bacterium]|nr:MAG: aminoglycoside phosphotransferase [Nitrospirota bacterium]